MPPVRRSARHAGTHACRDDAGRDRLDRPARLHLVSHDLCPYVQRAVISLTEKGIAHERTYIDLSAKPDWFRAISPLGKVPVLQVDGTTIFESAVICEYLDETTPGRLHPEHPLERARHRAWIEFGSSILDDIGGFYNAADATVFERKRGDLAGKFRWLEANLGNGPYFAGERFSMVDAVFGPVFRYFDVFDRIGDFHVFDDTPKVRAWRAALAARPSVRDAVVADYPERLTRFLKCRGSHLTGLMRGMLPAALPGGGVQDGSHGS
ncbi:MAG TPA: glutathione S-transferase family protein [Arenibaculum sp.]|nr:glutathione S-transferase family protein [Arenibaculum sp.]